MSHEYLHCNISAHAVVQNQYFLLRMSMGSCLDSSFHIISYLQANSGESFRDMRPWNALNYMIKLAEAAGKSLQVIANFQRHTRHITSEERKGYFMTLCELCKEMPNDERPPGHSSKNCGGWSCMSCGGRYCAGAAGHFTEHNAICNPETKGPTKVPDQVPDQAFTKRAEQAAAPKICLSTHGCKGIQPPHVGQFTTCDSCRVISESEKQRESWDTGAKRQKTPEEKLKAKEAS